MLGDASIRVGFQATIGGYNQNPVTRVLSKSMLPVSTNVNKFSRVEVLTIGSWQAT